MKNLKIIIAFGLIILASACKKKQDIIEPVSPPKDVYVVGYEMNSSNFFVAKLWKNGVSTSLSDGTKDAIANSVVVVGTDVYIAGYTYKTAGGIMIPALWKNGIMTELPTLGGIGGNAKSIAVNGTDIYVVGYENGSTIKATIWKNGVASYLPLDVSYNLYSGSASQITVSGTDIYVTGIKNSGATRSVALWKNGVYSTVVTDAVGNSVAVTGADVYVLGVADASGLSYLWKNGFATNFIETGKTNYPQKVVASNNNIYMAGYEALTAGGYNAKIWKNGSPSIIATNAFLYDLFIVNEDVYVVGITKSATNQNTATIWKNGVATNLTDGTKMSNVNGIFVK